jgi:E3 ubiquitin-protein ligase MARCH5
MELRPDEQAATSNSQNDQLLDESETRNNVKNNSVVESDAIDNHDTSLSFQKRLCWVCFGTEQDDEDPDVVWICPCQCKGSMKWVHEECVQRWVDEKQKRTNSMRVSCSQCKTQYILSFPPVNRFVRMIEQYDKLLYGSSPFVAGKC